MRRFPRAFSWLAAAIVVGCGTPEEQIVNRFLTAVQNGDEAVAAALSMESFPGEVRSWEVLEIGPESTEPFRYVELREAAIEARKAFEAKVEENNAFLRENEQNYLRYRERIDEDPDYKFTRGPLAEFQQEWEARLEEQKALEQKALEAEKAFEMERDAARKSVKVPVGEAFEGDVAVKKVKVRVVGGEDDGVYELTLRRYGLRDTEKGITPMANWIIASIERVEG